MSEDATVLEDWLAADEVVRRDMLASDGERLVAVVESIVQRDADRSIEVGRSMIDAARNESTVARLLRARTTAEAYLGRHEDSIASAMEARRRALAVDDRVEAARALVAAMHPRSKSGRLADAIEGGEIARRELLDADAEDLAIRVDLNLGNIHKAMGEPERALEHLGRVVDHLESGDPIRPHALNAIGECRYVLDQLDAADESFREAIDLLGEDGGLAGAIVLANRADVAGREGRIEEALELFTEARRRCDLLGAASQAARIMIETGDALESAGLLDEAAQLIELALDPLEEADLGFERSRGLLILSRIDLVSGRIDRAEERAELAAEGFSKLGNRRLADRGILLAIEACLAADRIEDADGRLEELRRRTSPDPVTVVGQASMEAEVRAKRDDWEAAAEFASRAVEAAAELGVPPISIECDARLARMLVRGGRLDAGISTARRAVGAIERIRAGFGVDRIRTGFLSSRTAAYESLVEGLVLSGDPTSLREAFEVMERSRSRELVERALEQLEAGEAAGDADGSIAALRRRLRVLYSAMERDGLDDQRRIRVDGRQAEIDTMEIELDRRLLELAGRSELADAVASFDDVVRSLPPDVALVEYFIAGGRLLAFTLVEGRLEVVDTGSDPRDIARLATELHFQCRRRLRGDPGPRISRRMHEKCDEVLRELHRRLVEPLGDRMEGVARWLVVPHGPLVAVPFHALRSEDGYLVDRFVMTTAVSASAAIRGERSGHRPEGVLVATVGDERAPSIREEGDRVAALHRGAVRLDAAGATADAVLDGLRSSRVAHLACHGRFLPGSPRSSGLRLADRWVTVRDVRELGAAPETVILSGCETGLHPQFGANELLGLSRALASNGTRTVVASLWSVHDAACTTLMTAMHATIAEGRATSLGEPLARAQRTLRDTHPHPAYWAPFFCAEPCVRRFDRSNARGTRRVLRPTGEER